METIFDFSGKTILITGASSGIGRQAAISLSKLGARTVLIARREEQLKETLGMLSGEGHICKPFDLAELDNIEALVSEIVAETGKLDGMAFCAGVAPTLPSKVTTPKVLTETMQINFFSFYEMTRHFIKKKYSVEGAKIVVLSSLASTKPGRGQSAYAASKAAIDATVKGLAKEVIPRKICINSIQPCVVDTPMIHKYCEETGKSDTYLDNQPFGIITPDEVANMIVYLLSSAADKITGTAIPINGGSLLL